MTVPAVAVGVAEPVDYLYQPAVDRALDDDRASLVEGEAVDANSSPFLATVPTDGVVVRGSSRWRRSAEPSKLLQGDRWSDDAFQGTHLTLRQEEGG